jgi:hypothetical protein
MPRVSTATITDTPQKAAIDRAVHEAYAAEGYLQDDGSRDQVKVREHMFEVLRTRKVLGLKERKDKAVTRGAMVELVFPHLSGPATFTESEDPQLALAAWDKIDAMLWSEAAPRASSALQRLVGYGMGNGYVLCRTTVGNDQVPASYVTDVLACIEVDFIKPDNDALARKVDTVVKNREMLILRQPQNGARFLKSLDTKMKDIGSAAHNQLALTVSSVTEPEPGDEPEE